MRQDGPVQRHDEEDERCHEPEHEHMFGNGEIDSEYGRDLNKRQLMIIGNMLNNRVSGVEMRFSRFGRSDVTNSGFLNQYKSQQ